jgi:hypothetical protein
MFNEIFLKMYCALVKVKLYPLRNMSGEEV